MIQRTLLALINNWAKQQKTKIAESAREELKQAARFGQNLVVMTSK